MKTAIVIGTSPGRESWVKECLASIESTAIVVSSHGRELGQLKWVYENTNLDKFIFLQDSVVVRDEEGLLKLMEQDGSTCLMDVPRCMGSYLGIYERSVLDRVEIPITESQEDAIREEMTWGLKYRDACQIFNHPIPKITHQQVYTVMKNGRKNLLYINQFYEKWKGTWR